jgi:hypothetical protein
MFDDYLSYFTDFRKAERMRALLSSTRGGDGLFEDLSRLFKQDTERATAGGRRNGPSSSGYTRLKEKHFYILWDSLYLNQPELVQKGLDVDLYYK